MNLDCSSPGTCKWVPGNPKPTAQSPVSECKDWPLMGSTWVSVGSVVSSGQHYRYMNEGYPLEKECMSESRNELNPEQKQAKKLRRKSP